MKSVLGLLSVFIASFCLAQENPSAKEWEEDLDFFFRSWSENHPDPWRGISKKEFELQIDNIRDNLTTWDKNQIFIELTKIIASTTIDGKDGHTSIWPIQKATDFSLFPFHLYWFDDDIFIVDADPSNENLIGHRLVKIGGYPIAEVIDKVEVLVSKENDYWVRSWSPLFAMVPEILKTFYSDVTTEVDFEFESPNNEIITKRVKSVSAADYSGLFPLALNVAILPGTSESPMYLQDNDDYFWDRQLSEGVLYFHYKVVLPENNDGETFVTFVKQLGNQIEKNEIKHLIIDLRNNGGGDNTTYAPFFNMIDELIRINKAPNLYVLIGRVTFSAAINFAVDLEKKYPISLIGEPTGGSPNQYGDPEYFQLPNSKLRIRISTKYWNLTGDADKRIAVFPSLKVNLSSTDYFNNIDPVLVKTLELIRSSR